VPVKRKALQGAGFAVILLKHVSSGAIRLPSLRLSPAHFCGDSLQLKERRDTSGPMEGEAHGFQLKTVQIVNKGRDTERLLGLREKPITGRHIMGIRHIAILISCSLVFGGEAPRQLESVNKQVIEAPKDYWETFPDGVDKVVVKIHTTDVLNPIFPNLFVKNHPAIKDFTIDDPDAATRLARTITGASGVAGAKLFKHRRTFTQEMGTISFYRQEEKFDVTISNAGFFMGPELNDYHLFYSWRLAKLVNDISLKHGPGLCQEGFNSLSGARGIAVSQFMEICDGVWDRERFQIYEQRPAKVWDIFPSFDEWPGKASR